MSGLTLAASGEKLDLTGANLSYVVVVAVIALVALGFAVALRRSVLAAGQGTEKMQTIARGRAGGRVRVPHPAVQDAGRLRRARARPADPAAR